LSKKLNLNQPVNTFFDQQPMNCRCQRTAVDHDLFSMPYLRINRLIPHAMKLLVQLVILFFFSSHCHSQAMADTIALKQSLDKATAAIRRAFGQGDAALIGQLHSPQVIKYFGGKNVIVGRDAVEKGARGWFEQSTVEFIENTVEDTAFMGDIALQTVIFSIKATPKTGGKSTINRGRAMVIYIQDKSSPTGWLTLREIAQEAP
jgi:ketosteroid isomerase-like protein